MAIDLQALDKLRVIVGGSDADLVELVASFLQEAPTIVEALAVAERGADVAAMRRAAHSLKSNARDMGARDLAELCARLEAQCAAGLAPGRSDVEAAARAFDCAAADLHRLYPQAEAANE